MLIMWETVNFMGGVCMSEQDLKQHRCCFTGHRPEKLSLSEKEIKLLLERAIDKAIADGFVTFISGMARGTDMWAAEIVLMRKKGNTDIHLICASPFEGFEERWSNKEQEKYRDIIGQADLVKYICKQYSRDCFQIRNEWMVDKSSRVIAVYNGEPSGTGNTVKYALKNGVEVENVLKNI